MHKIEYHFLSRFQVIQNRIILVPLVGQPAIEIGCLQTTQINDTQTNLKKEVCNGDKNSNTVTAKCRI